MFVQNNLHFFHTKIQFQIFERASSVVYIFQLAILTVNDFIVVKYEENVYINMMQLAYIVFKFLPTVYQKFKDHQQQQKFSVK